MATGKVKWFNNAKGYGFILPESGGGDLFAHYSSIEMDGYKTLKAGQDVEFDVVEGPKGYHAVNIRGGASEEIDEESPDRTTDSLDSDAPIEQIDAPEPEPASHESPEVAS
ncbi:MAG: cold shock domain-containing protein CspD [Gammaproteobacteria bacterium]|nr:cold shock domain-containing protein CspD [Gammaproteobacteria bacterium]